MKVLFLVLIFCAAFCFGTEQQDAAKVQEGQKKMSEYVLAILEHYKQEDPIGIPGVPIPDPYSIPPMDHSTSLGKMKFKDVKLFGLSKFRINHVVTKLAEMKVEAALTIDTMLVLGNYTLSTWLSKSTGPFTVNLKGVYIQANASLEVERNGTLEAQDIKMDTTFKNIDMKFENLPMMAKMVENFINSMGAFVFDSIKPYLLGLANANIRSVVNKEAKKIPQKFPNSISPFDQLVSIARKKIRQMGYEPYNIQDYKNTIGVFSVHLSHTWLMGISSIHRVGDFNFEVKNNTLRADVLVGTQKLEGSTHWDVALIGGVLSKTGIISFTVDYLHVRLIMNQSMDTRNHPEMEDLQLELGNIQIRSDGAGTADYIVEFAVNVLPNLLRYQIMDAMESPLKRRIQMELNNINVEKMIHENIDKIDDIEKTGINNLF